MSCTHEKVVYTVCGCVHHQCRCIEGGKNVRTILGPCPRHAATTAGDGSLTFAEAMALDPSDVECREFGHDPWHRLRVWEHSPLLMIRNFQFRRRNHPKRSLVQEMADMRKFPRASHDHEAMTEAILAVCEYLREHEGVDKQSTCWRPSEDIERHFLEPR